MYKAVPTTSIPGTPSNPNYQLETVIGGIVEIDQLTVLNQQNLNVVIDYSPLLGITTDTTSKPGFTIVNSTSYFDYDIYYISSSLIIPGSIFTGGVDTYSYLIIGGVVGPKTVANNILTLNMENDLFNSQNITMSFGVSFKIIKSTYIYANSFTQEELFEDLKTLPETVITELKKLDCEKMQGALGLLKSFNDAKLVS